MTTRTSTILRGAVLAAAVALLPAAAAHAELTAPQLVTVSPLEQSDGVTGAVLSADGRHLVFTGSLGGVAGILRRDLRTGLTEPVAAGSAYIRSVLTDTARDPSVSADGRYVAFTTSAALDPDDDTNAAPDVYVRDMEASVPADGAACPAGGACAYTLASAADGRAGGLSYTSDGGATATPRQAITADGRRVAFVVNAESDLAGPGTPGGQVAVRDLDTRRTTLVTALRDRATGAMTTLPVPGRAVTLGEAGPGGPGGAAISADGTTVAWSGQRIADQAPVVAGDPADTTANPYNEPLWRRIADGPSAPTRRVAGAGDPEAPGCPAGGSIAVPACQGPFPDLGNNFNGNEYAQGGWVSIPTWDGIVTPSLSADGRTVAFLGAPPVGPTHAPSAGYDLFVADMRPGPSRRAAVRRLTQDLSGAPLTDLALSADGRRIAFATMRTTFALSPPYLIGTPPPRLAGVAELWLVDLAGQTLQRLSRTVDAGPSSAGTVGSGTQLEPSSPSMDATGHLIAWVSKATNLVAVDANGAGDAFLVEDRAVPPGAPGRVEISPPPAAPRVARAWTLALRAVSGRDGSLRFDATVPGAGVLRATVTATVPVTKRVTVRTRGGKRRTVRRKVLVKRQVAVASMVVRAAGLSRLTVRVTKAYRSLTRTKAGLDASAKVAFSAPSHPTLRDALDVRFRVAKARRKAVR
jgi:Tol biopolymer transport system component